MRELDQLLAPRPRRSEQAPPTPVVLEGTLTLKSGARYVRIGGESSGALLGPVRGGEAVAAGQTVTVVIPQTGVPTVVHPGSGGGGSDVNVDATASAVTLAPGVPASVIVSEPTPNLFDFDFGIPAGAAGAQGPAGPQGPQGPAGASGASVPLVTVLPTNPVDGQTVDFQNAVMASAGMRWRFVYRASSTSPYKWEFVGGSQWITVTPGATVPPVNAWADVAPTMFTLPLSGDYTMSVGGSGVSNLVNDYWALRGAIGGVVSSPVYAVSYVAGYSADTAIPEVPFYARVAGDIARAQVTTINGGGRVDFVAITLTPRRVL